MTKIALDTNIWIYLTKDTFYELWVKLKQGKEDGDFEIIVNDVIWKEWIRNKTTTIRTLTENIKNEYKNALNLSRYLSGEEKEKFIQTLSFYKDESNRIKKAEERVQEIESFMNTCTCIHVTEEQKLFVSDLAIEKHPPFQNNKNNFNDSLIIRNIAEYVKSEFLFQYDLIYISNNPDDFTNKKTGEIYSELLEGLEYVRIKSVTELGEAFKLAPECVEDFDAWLEMELDNQAMYELDIMRGK